MTDDQLRGLANYDESPHFDETQRLCLHYADAVTATPTDVPATLFSELRRCFSNQQLVELTGMIAWENCRSRNNHAFDLGSDGFHEGVCPLPTRTPALPTDPR